MGVTRISGVVTGVQHALLFKLAEKHLFKPRPDDVFVAAYPKSGTTLTEMILYQLTTDGEMDFPHIDCVIPFLEQEFMRGNPGRFEAMASPRLFKTHLVRERAPAGGTVGRYIYLVRNLDDVAVSAYHHHCLLSGLEHDFDRYVGGFVRGRVPLFNSWARHYESWWPHRHDPNVLFLRYEDLVGDLAASVRRLASFCDIPLDEAAMPRILERCSPAFMRRYEDRFDPRLRRISRRTESFIRRAQAGEGATRLSAAQREKLEARVAELARKLGCDESELYGSPSRQQFA